MAAFSLPCKTELLYRPDSNVLSYTMHHRENSFGDIIFFLRCFLQRVFLVLNSLWFYMAAFGVSEKAVLDRKVYLLSAKRGENIFPREKFYFSSRACEGGKVKFFPCKNIFSPIFADNKLLTLSLTTFSTENKAIPR